METKLYAESYANDVGTIQWVNHRGEIVVPIVDILRGASQSIGLRDHMVVGIVQLHQPSLATRLILRSDAALARHRLTICSRQEYARPASFLVVFVTRCSAQSIRLR